MGAGLTPGRALAHNATNARTVSVEFSLVAFFSFDPCVVCSGGVAVVSRFEKARIYDPGRSRTWTRGFDGDCNVRVAGGRLLSISIGLDSCRTRCALVLVGISTTRFWISAMRSCYDHVLRFPGDISLHPDKLRCSDVQFFSRLA